MVDISPGDVRIIQKTFIATMAAFFVAKLFHGSRMAAIPGFYWNLKMIQERRNFRNEWLMPNQGFRRVRVGPAAVPKQNSRLEGIFSLDQMIEGDLQ